jgi:hypothetical protein
LLPFLAGVASLFVYAFFARRTLTRWEALIGVAVFAASYYPMRHGCEVKPYATDMFLSLLLIVCGWSVWENPRSPGRWAALTALAVLAVWGSFPAVFTAAAVGLLVTVRVWSARCRLTLGWWATLGIGLAASWSAMAAFYAVPHARAAVPNIDTVAWQGAYPPIGTPWRLPWWLLEVHAGNMLAYPIGGKGFRSIITLFYVTTGSIVLWRRRPALLWLLLGALPFNFIAAALHRYPYGTSARISLYMAPSFCMLGGLGAAACVKWLLGRRLAPAGLLCSAGALGLIPIVGMGVDLARPYRSQDDLEHRRIVRTLAAATDRSDQWLIYNGLAELPRWSEMMLSPWVQQEAEVRFYLLQQAPVPIQWVKDPVRVDQLDTGGGRLWLITHKSGFPLFPENVLAYVRDTLAARRGAPRRERFKFRAREEIEVDVFDAPSYQRGPGTRR